MAREAEARHHTLLWGDATDLPSDDLGNRAVELAKRYVGMRVAGVFFAPVEFASGKDAVNRKVVELCDANGIPVVLLDRDLTVYPHRSRRDRTFVCANDLTAARLMHTFEEISVSVPDDVRVAGFDDVAYAHLLRVPLTSVRQPAQAIGSAAVRAMFERLADPAIPGRDILLPTTVVLRRSTSRPRTRSK
ncbi:MAG: substrate-binding domain-containing protein [Planctomycetia bacterium]|nr:substrate-binding domain-containing protein [Planctomycetia bacterium]